MPKSSIEELVEAALDRLPPEHTEEVVLDVFETIENDPALLHEYRSLCEQYRTSRLSGPGNVNPTISTRVMKKTGRSTLSRRHPSTRGTFIETYSRLDCRDPDRPSPDETTRRINMELAWWRALGRDNRESRPRCVLLADGNRHAVAARLASLVSLPDVTVSPDDLWMPYGKPVQTGKGWDKSPAAEARIDRDDGFVAPQVRQQLVDWWLVVVPRSNTPHWDVAATCNIDGRDGLILVEAKAHSSELSGAGKSQPRTDNGVHTFVACTST